MKIILASESPRRIKLLKKVVGSFSAIPSRFDESQIQAEDPISFALKAAEAKAKEVAKNHLEALVIAADTVVTLDGKIFGKPADRTQAREMLLALSGRTHEVVTAIALYHQEKDRLLTGYEVSRVTFKNLTQNEIEDYLDRNTYQDKAGAYAIQEIKRQFVERLEGDYHNVVGLPLRLLRRLLNNFREEKTVVEITDFRLPEAVGLARKENSLIEVPGAYPGDVVEISFLPSGSQQVKGKLISLIRPGTFREKPPCPHAGLCGGCAFQDLNYEEQLRQKQKYLTEIFCQYFPDCGRYLEIEKILPSPARFFYRNKMEFSFGQSDGKILLGLREKTRPHQHRRPNRVVPLEICHLCTPLTARIFAAVCRLADQSGLPVFDLVSKKGFFRHLVIREGKKTDQLMLIIVTTSQAKLPAEEFRAGLLEAVPELTSLWWVENDRIADVVAYEKMHLLHGQEAIEEELLGLRFKIYPSSFFQTNPLAAELVYSGLQGKARELRTQSALGLYCGSGAIEICLSRAAYEVVGIDWEADNIKTATENLAINGIKNVRFVESSVEAALPAISRGSFDLLVLDPPRAGLSPRGLKRVISLKIPELLYVSCNPVTLARDLRELVRSGYKINSLTPVDFFPHTPHLEIVAHLSL